MTVHLLGSPLWHVLTRLGEAEILLPAAMYTAIKETGEWILQ